MQIPRTWFLDFDGTLVFQKSHVSDEDTILPGTKEFFEKVVRNDDCVVITTARKKEDHEERIIKFVKHHNIKCDKIICDLPSGKRILINDKKPDGMLTAHSHNLERDKGINIEDFINI